MAWLSFIELDKAVVLVWLDLLVFCDYGFNVSDFWCPLATPTVLFGFLLPWTWGISSWLLQQSTALLVTLDEGYLLTTTPPDLERGVALLGPPASWQLDGEKMETMTDFIFLGSKITADGDCSHEIKRWLLLGRKAMTNLDGVLRNRDITLPTKV